MKKILVILGMLACCVIGAFGYKYLVENGKIQDGAYVPAKQYVILQNEHDSIQFVLEDAVATIKHMQECCSTNNVRYNEEIERLINELNTLQENSSGNELPFSVLFKKNSVELDDTAKEIVRVVSVAMKSEPKANYTLYGYGDYTGSDDYNQIISEARCESVKKELVSHGVSEDRIQIVGYGNTKYFGDRNSFVNQRVAFRKN